MQKTELHVTHLLKNCIATAEVVPRHAIIAEADTCQLINLSTSLLISSR